MQINECIEGNPTALYIFDGVLFEESDILQQAGKLIFGTKREMNIPYNINTSSRLHRLIDVLLTHKIHSFDKH